MGIILSTIHHCASVHKQPSPIMYRPRANQHLQEPPVCAHRPWSHLGT